MQSADLRDSHGAFCFFLVRLWNRHPNKGELFLISSSTRKPTFSPPRCPSLLFRSLTIMKGIHFHAPWKQKTQSRWVRESAFKGRTDITLVRRCKLDKLAISKKPSRYKLVCYEWWKKVLNCYMVRWNGQKWSLCWSTGAFHAQHAGMTLFASIIVSSSKTACWIYAWNDKNVRRVQVKFPCKTIEFSKGISGTVRTCCRTVPEPDLRQTGTFASVWDTFPTTSMFFFSLYLFRLWWQEDSTNTCTRVPTNWVLHWNKRHRLVRL